MRTTGLRTKPSNYGVFANGANDGTDDGTDDGADDGTDDGAHDGTNWPRWILRLMNVKVLMCIPNIV